MAFISRISTFVAQPTMVLELGEAGVGEELGTHLMRASLALRWPRRGAQFEGLNP